MTARHLIPVLLVLSCSSGPAKKANLCVPNQSVACVGIGGCPGGQSCLLDGSGYSPCACNPAASIATTASSGASGSAASSATNASSTSGTAGVTTVGATSSGSHSGSTGAGSLTATSTGNGTGSSGVTTSTTTGPSTSGTSTTSTSASSSSSSSSGSPTCTVGSTRCAPAGGGLTQEVEDCLADGGWADAGGCAGTTYCGVVDGGAVCGSPCQAAETASSYLGCDYWGALLSNSQLAAAFTGNSANGAPGTLPSDFAFVVTNVSDTLTANVSITPGTLPAVTAAIPPSTIQAIYLPWLPICGTGLAPFGYHLTSDQPVTVYQFNPLHSSLGDVDGGTGTYSYTNDASLLLPTHVLGTGYVVASMNQITEGNAGGPTDGPLAGSFAIVAVHDNTQVRVSFAGEAASTAANSSGTTLLCPVTQGNLPGQAAGTTVPFTLSQGQVLQFWAASVGTPTCTASINGDTVCLYPNDLTGTVVTSVPTAQEPDGGPASPAQPVAVFGGADCTYVPYNQVACDHIEEEMFPLTTWGRHYVGVKTAPYTNASSAYPDFFRVISACDTSSCPSGAMITFTPEVPVDPGLLTTSTPGASWCANANGSTTCLLPPVTSSQMPPWIGVESGASFFVTSDQPISVAQYLVSQTEAGPNTSVGDPDLLLLPPVEQWRTSYTVLAPNTFLDNYLDLVVQQDAAHPTATANVLVDGSPLLASEWTNVPNTPFYTATHRVCGRTSAVCTGSHTISSVQPVGVTISGYDSYVTYSYAGGLNLETLSANPPSGCTDDAPCSGAHGNAAGWFCDATGTCQLGCVPDAQCNPPQQGCCDTTQSTCSPITHACTPFGTTGTSGSSGTTGGCDCTPCTSIGEGCDQANNCACIPNGTTGSTGSVNPCCANDPNVTTDCQTPLFCALTCCDTVNCCGFGTGTLGSGSSGSSTSSSSNSSTSSSGSSSMSSSTSSSSSSTSSSSSGGLGSSGSNSSGSGNSSSSGSGS